MRRKGTVLLGLCGWMFCAPQSHDNMHALEKMYKALGGSVNATSLGGLQDQAAGYYTAGGLYMRQKNTTLQPLQVSLPHIGVGCNGLDLYMGAFSFRKGEQLVQLVRSLGTAVPTYAMQLALKTIAPQVENLLSQLQKTLLDLIPPCSIPAMPLSKLSEDCGPHPAPQVPRFAKISAVREGKIVLAPELTVRNPMRFTQTWNAQS